jgi:hypothetical protein
MALRLWLEGGASTVEIGRQVSLAGSYLPPGPDGVPPQIMPPHTNIS